MTSEEYIREKAPKWYVVLLRLFMGYYFLYVGVSRFLHWREDAEFLKKKLGTLADATQFGWFQTYLDRVIVPFKESSTTLFTWLLIAAPLLLGLSLVLGWFTRLSTFLGTLLVLNFFFIKYHAADVYLMMFLQTQLAVLVVLFFAASGRKLGIDGVFWRNRVRRKLEPPEVSEVKRVAPTRASEPKSIPLSRTGPARVEDTVGHFSTQVRKQETPGITPGRAAPAPAAGEKPEEKPEGENKPGPGS